METATAASRKHQAQQSWLAMTQTHLLICFHAKSANYILILSQRREIIIPQNAGVLLYWEWQLVQKSTEMCRLFVTLLEGIPHLASELAKKQHWHSYRPVQYFGNSGLVFNDLNSSKADVISTGEDALVSLYKGEPSETLGHLRLQKFQHKVIVKP